MSDTPKPFIPFPPELAAQVPAHIRDMSLAFAYTLTRPGIASDAAGILLALLKVANGWVHGAEQSAITCLIDGETSSGLVMFTCSKAPLTPDDIKAILVEAATTPNTRDTLPSEN